MAPPSDRPLNCSFQERLIWRIAFIQVVSNVTHIGVDLAVRLGGCHFKLLGGHLVLEELYQAPWLVKPSCCLCEDLGSIFLRGGCNTSLRQFCPIERLILFTLLIKPKWRKIEAGLSFWCSGGDCLLV